MPDPSAFLSTIAATSSALVAIVGGLLVARFVSIASEQEGAERVVHGAEDRLATAKRREQAARDALCDWDIHRFFTAKVLRAIWAGEQTVAGLRKVDGDTSLTDKEIAAAAKGILIEFETAKTTLQKMIPTDSADTTNEPDWDEFRNTHPFLPETAWDDVWDIVYEDIARPPQSARPPALRDFSMPPLPSFLALRPPEYVALDIQRRDALRADLAHAEQQAEDLDAELGRIQRTRDMIVRPKGLMGGLVVLGFFTLVGIIIPIWLMSRGPTHLTAHLGEVVFWLFFAGLAALLGYMAVLALRLSNGRQSTGTDHHRRGHFPWLGHWQKKLHGRSNWLVP